MKKLDLKDALLLGFVVVVLAPITFWMMRIVFGQVVFEPYLISQLFAIVVAFISIVVVDVKGGSFLTFIIAFALSAEMYWIADMMNASQLEFYNSRTWDACPSSPDLPNITWGWGIQSIISAAIATIYTTIVVICKITERKKTETK